MKAYSVSTLKTKTKMTQQEIKDKVLPIAAKYLNENASDIDVAANMEEHYGADSLDITEIAMDVERAFSISLSDESIRGFKTVQDIIDEVQRHILD